MHWFGITWLITTAVVLLAAVVLVLTARRIGRRGRRGAGLLQLAALVEVIAAVLALAFHWGTARLEPSAGFDPQAWGMVVLEVWLVARPILHALALVLVTIGIGRLVRSQPPAESTGAEADTTAASSEQPPAEEQP